MELMLKLCCGDVLLTSSLFFFLRIHGTWHVGGGGWGVGGGVTFALGIESYSDRDKLCFIMSKCPIKREGENRENI